jgi:hypothetical protein
MLFEARFNSIRGTTKPTSAFESGNLKQNLQGLKEKLKLLLRKIKR